MKQIFIIVFFLFVMNMHAQKTISLWNGNPPTENELTGSEKAEDNGRWISNISAADITIYQPKATENNGMAVIICPGGGYAGLAYIHEGVQFAQWLNTQGITAIILKYRMPNKHKEIPLDDVHQAMKYVREHAEELKINNEKIGVAGFSAGGHLAAMASTHYETTGVNTRPDFSILFYPVVTMEVKTHGGSRANLLGDNPSESDILFYSAEKHVNNNTPPTILLLSDDDESVSTLNSTTYYNALNKNNVPTSIYIFPEGGHGWGMNADFRYHNEVLSLLTLWLDDIKNK